MTISPRKAGKASVLKKLQLTKLPRCRKVRKLFVRLISWWMVSPIKRDQKVATLPKKNK